MSPASCLWAQCESCSLEAKLPSHNLRIATTLALTPSSHLRQHRRALVCEKNKSLHRPLWVHFCITQTDTPNWYVDTFTTVWVRCRRQSGSLAWKYTTIEVLENWTLCRKSVALLTFCPAFEFLLVTSPTTHQSLFPAIKSAPALTPNSEVSLVSLFLISQVPHVSPCPWLSPLPLTLLHASWARHASLMQTPPFHFLLLQNPNRWWLHVVSSQVALAFPVSGDNAKHDCEGAGYITGILPVIFSFLFCPLLIHIFSLLTV